MNKTNSLNPGVAPQGGSSPNLAKELGELVNIISEKKYITERLVDLLNRWEGFMNTITEMEKISTFVDGKRIGLDDFDDWAGTARYVKHLFNIEGKILPSTREEIGKTYCNYTNVLSRRWRIMNYEDLKWLIRNISSVTVALLKEYAEKMPGVYDEQKMRKIIKCIKEVK